MRYVSERTRRRLERKAQLVDKGIGSCPFCGMAVVPSGSKFQCIDRIGGQCCFEIKPTFSNNLLKKDDLEDLLRKGRTRRLVLKSTKKNTMYEAELQLFVNRQSKTWRIVPDFKNGAGGSGEDEKLGKCPECGSPVTENSRAYGCTNWQTKGCQFKIWKTICGLDIPKEVAADLLANKRSAEKLEGFVSKKGKPFSAWLALEKKGEGWRTVFQFKAE